MTSHDARQYHLLELEIALSARDPRRIMPEIPRSTQRLLDVGCGAGQTILGLQLGPDVEAVGIDPDNDAVSLGRSWTASAQLVCGRGESLPFPDASFDFVMSRVALPYTNIPEATREIGRVLRPGGHLWITLQPLSSTLAQLRQSVQKRLPRAILFQTYSLANGVLLHFTGRLVRWPSGRGKYESFQTSRGIKRILNAAQFVDVEATMGDHFLVTARRRPS